MATIKVFCEDCIFYMKPEHTPRFDFGPPQHQLDKCLAPQNFKDGAIKPKEIPMSQPSIINRFQNCIWHISKGTPSSSSSGFFSSSSSSSI